MTDTAHSVDANQALEPIAQIPQAQLAEPVQPLLYNELLSKCTSLEISYASLQTKTSILESKNKYWTDLFGKVDKAIAIKVNEFDTLQKAHHELKVCSACAQRL